MPPEKAGAFKLDDNQGLGQNNAFHIPLKKVEKPKPKPPANQNKPATNMHEVVLKKVPNPKNPKSMHDVVLKKVPPSNPVSKPVKPPVQKTAPVHAPLKKPEPKPNFPALKKLPPGVKNPVPSSSNNTTKKPVSSNTSNKPKVNSYQLKPGGSKPVQNRPPTNNYKPSKGNPPSNTNKPVSFSQATSNKINEASKLFGVKLQPAKAK